MLTLYDEKGRTCTIGKLLHRVNIRDTDESHTAIVEEFGDRQICSGEIMRRSNCSAPIPPRAPPGTSLFLLLPRGSYHLNFYLPCPI